MRKMRRRRSPIDPKQSINYKDVELLQSFVNDQGKIMSRRSTFLTLKQQRQLSKAVKRARMLTLLPFSGKIRN